MKEELLVIKVARRTMTVIGCCLLVVGFAACGDYLEFGTDDDPTEEPKMGLKEHAVTLMAGDSSVISPMMVSLGSV